MSADRQEIRRRAETYLRTNGVFRDASPGVKIGSTFMPSFAVVLDIHTDEVQIVGSFREGKTLIWLDIHVGAYTVLQVANDGTEDWDCSELGADEVSALELKTLTVLRQAMVLDDLAGAGSP